MKEIDTIQIMPGMYCNLSCKHCAGSCGPNRKEKITKREIETISDDVNFLRPKTLLFTGGEPTFFLSSINSILQNIEDFCYNVTITTNGWFLENKNQFQEIFNSLVKVNRIQLSLDRFHKIRCNKNNLHELKNYCKEIIVRKGILNYYLLCALPLL
ncbi:MAG: radical SAM protein [Pseudomonadota bacterium]